MTPRSENPAPAAAVPGDWRDAPAPVVLIGGWGYGNLGDDAILAGYLTFLNARGIVPTVLSRDPLATFHAMLPDARAVVLRESLTTRERQDGSVVILCGGGYLNGAWRREPTRKLAIGLAHGRGGTVCMHGVEFTSMDGLVQRTLIRKVTPSLCVTRDATSMLALEQLGVIAATGCDSIALARPVIARLSGDARSSGRVLVNLHDVPRRPDTHQAEFATASYARKMTELLQELAHCALGLAIDDADAAYMRRTFPDLPFVQPRSVAELMAVIKGSAGVVSTRMHPGLIGSLAGRPTAIIAYNGKITPTLRALDLDDLCIRGEGGSRRAPLDTAGVLTRLQEPASCYEFAWKTSAEVSESTLGAALASAQNVGIRPSSRASSASD